MQISNSNRTQIKLGLIIIAIILIIIQTAAADLMIADTTVNNLGTPLEEKEPIQLPAEISQPVRWAKQVTAKNIYDQEISEIYTQIPEDAILISVIEANTGKKFLFEVNNHKATIKDTLSFNEEKEYIFQYKTTPPEKTETTEVTKTEGTAKNIVISSKNHYNDVFSYTNITPIPVEQSNRIKLYWYIDGIKTDVTNNPDFEIKFIDSNKDGFVEQLSWITPHLSTQVFEIMIISQEKSNSQGINIKLNKPTQNEYITNTTNIEFGYTINKSANTTVFCNISVDNTILHSNIPSFATVIKNSSISSGTHTWQVSCSGGGFYNLSEENTFTIDVDSPIITLSTPDYYTSNSGSVLLNFTALDYEDSSLTCTMWINGILNRTGFTVSNNSEYNFGLSNLNDGVYTWNTSCKDSASNIGISEERIFYISTNVPNNYDITPNKESYALGETGYLVINGRQGSNLTLFVSPPDSNSFFKYFNGVSYPLVDIINFTTNAGTYDIDGIFYYGGLPYVIKTKFDVVNNLDAEIKTNKTTGEPGDIFYLQASAEGGIGTLTHNWQLGDGSTATGEEITHTYGSPGEYKLELSTTDINGNEIKDSRIIYIYEKYNVLVKVVSKDGTTPVSNYTVELSDERKTSDSNGDASFVVFQGVNRLYVISPEGKRIKRIENITSDKTITVNVEYETEESASSEISETTAPETEANTDETEEQLENNIEITNPGEKAEVLLVKIENALNELREKDKATEDVLRVFEIELKLQKARKDIRYLLRDVSNIDSNTALTPEEKESQKAEKFAVLNTFDTLITTVEVLESSEYVDYPKEEEINNIVAEYAKETDSELSKNKIESYSKKIIELQKEFGIKTRIANMKFTYLSGETKDTSAIINTITKKPEETNKLIIAEYIPKEITETSDDLKSDNTFKVLKQDPIIGFYLDGSEYYYYLEKAIALDDLKKIKRVVITEDITKDSEGMKDVTGLMLLPKIKIENKKMFIEILIILILLISYLTYHFELIDKIKSKVDKKKTDKKENFSEKFSANSMYLPETKFEIIKEKIKPFIEPAKNKINILFHQASALIKKEDMLLKNEIDSIMEHIRLTHKHIANKDHKNAKDAYLKVKERYAEISTDAKSRVHEDTLDLMKGLSNLQVTKMIEKAFLLIDEGNYKNARNYYSEIQKIYKNMEKEHRAAVSEKCIVLHEKLFEQSLK